MKVINHINSTKKFDVEELLNYLAQVLEISEEAELTLMYNDNLLKQLSKGDIEYSALLQNPISNKYVLFVKSDVGGLQIIICHEMVHLKQYDSGKLKMSPDYKTVWWNGEKFDATLDYIEREWENEAFSLQNKLWRKFKKHKKNNERIKD